jgi:hypothetical protein
LREHLEANEIGVAGIDIRELKLEGSVDHGVRFLELLTQHFIQDGRDLVAQPKKEVDN